MSSVEVIKNPPRRRDVYEGLTGTIRASIIAESFLFVGSGRRSIGISEENVRRVLSGKRNFRQAAVELSQRIKLEHDEFSVSGGRAVVPGSSVKGNVRSRIELSIVPSAGKVISCLVRASRVSSEPGRGTQGWRHWRIWREGIEAQRGPPCDMTRGQTVCKVCDLFGSAGLISLIHFSDFQMGDGGLEPLSLDHGIKLMSARPGSVFNGSIAFMNLSPDELGLLLFGMGIRNSAEGLTILFGKLKYRKEFSGRQFGRGKFKVERIELSDVSKPLVTDGGELIAPGRSVSGPELNGVLRALRKAMLDSFSNYLVEIMEVERLHGIS
ncbi:MAG: RAMP superfamily CRISPR-associated protein [Aigarchaeota archaeon]|nr:RAMP superfamily CRISPR-associated protein [Candidatus Pelearchaeum maunauluense]